MVIAKTKILDFVAVGSGPSNLSLAALIKGSSPLEAPDVSFRILEKASDFSWHAKQQFPGSLMQSSFVRDLVTTVDPTNRYSFLQYLKISKRLMSFLNRGTLFPTRHEFSKYLEWVAGSIDEIDWGCKVSRIAFSTELNAWEVTAHIDQTNKSIQYHAQHLVVAPGWRPTFGAIDFDETDRRVVHVSDFFEDTSIIEEARRVAIIGAGQSAAEALLHFLNLPDPPRELVWLDRSPSPKMLNTSNFVREYYSVAYGEIFQGMSPNRRARVLELDRLAGLGISPNEIGRIYDTIYNLRVENSATNVRIVPDAHCHSICSSELNLEVNWSKDERKSAFFADLVLLATGFEPELELIKDYIPTGLVIPTQSGDYLIPTNAPSENKLFLQSSNYGGFGVGDGNLSSIPGRATKIINQMDLGFVLPDPIETPIVEW